MTTTPKPGPVTPAPPILAVPIRGESVNHDGMEARRRVVAMLLPYMRDPDDLLMIAAWIETGELLDDDEEDET